MALDKVSPAMMSPLSVSESAPSEPYVGQRWYRASTAITYQYTNDGTSSFWLDVSSSGIGTSADRGVDFVGDIDPHSAINGSGLAVGSVYYNREKNRHFVCTDATEDANVWSGRYSGAGGTATTVLDSGVYYRIHTFKADGTFSVDGATTCNILVVGGGGGSGYWGGCGGGGGSVYQRIDFSLAKGNHDVIIGLGGTGQQGSGSGNSGSGNDGTNSKLGTAHIGFGGGGGGSATVAGRDGGCGGGQDSDVGTAGQDAGKGIVDIAAGTSVNGDTLTADHKTYSFSSTPKIANNSATNGGGGGGAGGENGAYASGSMTLQSAGGHGGHGGIGKLISWATHEGTSVTNTDSGTRGYYGGGGHGVTASQAFFYEVPGGSRRPVQANTGAGGMEVESSTHSSGSAGIVIVRYAL